MKILCKQLFIFLISFLALNSLYSQKEEECISINRHEIAPRNSEEFPLRLRPIQGSIIVTKDRNEIIQLVLKENTGVAKITAGAFYEYGENEKFISEQKGVVFNDDGINGDEVSGDNIFTTNEINLHFEDWIETYWVRILRINISYFDESDNLILRDDMFLPYIVINPNFLNAMNDISVNYLTPDSSIIHIENAVYVDYEKALHKYVDSTLFWPDVPGFDEENRLEDLYDEIWEEPFFTKLGTGDFGVQNLNSNVFSFPLNGGSGNYYSVGVKTGNASFWSMFQNSTFVHELYHMYAPYFIAYMRDNIPESPFYNAGNFVHNPVQFFGQSGFGRHYPLPTGYANLCPEHIDELTKTQEGYEITITEACNLAGLNLVEGIPAYVHSDFELWLMNLKGDEVLDSVMYFGFNVENEIGADFVTWRFENLVEATKEEMIWMKNQWYNRDNGIYKDYYDANQKNMLIFFHGTGIPSYNELKTLNHFSDEIVSDELSQEVPVWREWGYDENDLSNRYISYNQATLGLGKLTNKFPLPPGIDPCDGPNPIEFVEPVDFCNGLSSTLRLNSSFASYEWSSGDTSSFIIVNNPGTYSITVTDNEGCTYESSVNVNEVPLPEVTITGPSLLCVIDNIILDAGQEFVSYEWSTGQVDQTIEVSNPGAYSVTVTDVNGCINSASYSVTLVERPNPRFISPPSDISVSCIEEVPQIQELEWMDECGNIGSVEGTEQTDGANCPEIISRSWIYTNNYGETITYQQDVVILDLEAATFSDIPTDIVISCTDDIPPVQNLSWTDNCDGSGTVTGRHDQNGNYITRTWTYTDNCGNTTSTQQLITLLDTAFITVYDTVTIMDTTYIEVVDTNYVTIYDTVSISVTDTLYIEVATTGTDDVVLKGEIKVYPNPSNDIVIIEFKEFDLFTDFILEIINVNGASVFNTRLNQERFEIPVSEIGPPGTYFINIQNENRQLVAVKTLILF